MGVVKDPTFPDPTKVCADCHESIVESAPHSLHYTIAPIRSAVVARASMTDPNITQTIDRVINRHFTDCHASCSQCHVSRPA